MTITIKTQLNSGIYASEGGGEVRIKYEWATGPRNLLKAIDRLFKHRTSMERSYGNVGCGSSWLEIDGIEIDRFDIDDVAQGDDPREFAKMYSYLQPKSRTQKASELIARIQAN